MKSTQYLVACGDSFLYGSDLSSPDQTWPCVVAQQLELEYQCRARPGVGNAQILQQILSAQAEFGQQAVYIINWTWIDRFDYVNVQDNTWHTTRPVLDDPERDPVYYRYFHSELADKFHNLVYINTAINTLKHHDSIMTYMDYLLLDQRWHAPDYIQILQQQIGPCLENFNKLNFLDWSREQQFPISDRWHPLEHAHQAAAAWWYPQVSRLIQTQNSNK
jgi:hypothetical protein